MCGPVTRNTKKDDVRKRKGTDGKTAEKVMVRTQWKKNQSGFFHQLSSWDPNTFSHGAINI